jgi:signal transduction histidine kinase
MFTAARLKLMLFYAAFFLCFFWIVSLSLYVWMEHAIGGSMLVSQVQQQEQHGQYEGGFDEQSVILAGAAALDQLKFVLLALNCGLVPTIPLAAWLLTGRTLKPVQVIHDQQQQFASDVSHELRTPLAIMSGEIEVVLKKNRSQKDYQQTLTSVKEETDRLIGLVENVLLLAHIEQAPLARAVEPVDLTDLINQVLGRFEQQRKEKHVSIHLTAAEESVVVRGQEALLRQLFFNLLENALKYTPEHGTITLELAQKKQYGIVTITDTGIGIAPEHQNRIFDRFYRIDAARSGSRGYGLGLAIAQAIVALHHGTIRVHSAVGQGTTFVLSFPHA